MMPVANAGVGMGKGKGSSFGANHTHTAHGDNYLHLQCPPKIIQILGLPGISKTLQHEYQVMFQ